MHECCENTDNREVIERRENGAVVEKCRACGRRHIEMQVEPGHIGAEFAGLGG